MISLFNLVIDLFQRNQIIQVRRMPLAKALRAQLFGLSLGLFMVLLATAVDLHALFAGQLWFVPILMFLLFMLGTAAGGLFVLLTAVLAFVPYSSPPTPTFWTSFHALSQWYFFGYLAGAITSILYNDLVFLFLTIFDKKHIKISFLYNPKKVLNVIKSPNSSEEIPFGEVDLDPEERKLYNFSLNEAPSHPYTILFIANGKILKKDGEANVAGDYLDDPIIKDRDLFLRTVDRALFSFEHNEVLGRPEIWSRTRVITLFDEELGNKPGTESGLAQHYRDDVVIADRIIDNLIDTGPHTVERVKQLFDTHKDCSKIANLSFDEVDVIYVLTASETHDRSTARYSDWVDFDNGEVTVSEVTDFGVGAPLKHDPDPIEPPANPSQPDYSKGTAITSTVRQTPAVRHDAYAFHPGRVALNVVSARNKTFVHEFAHAMSSAQNGMIVDEYADQFNIADEENQSQRQPQLFYVNRIERNRESGQHMVPVHKMFARYNEIDFYSDLKHPSAEEDWIGYFPDRNCCGLPCTMDRSFGPYRFDELLSNFVYDRLCSKLNRPDA